MIVSNFRQDGASERSIKAYNNLDNMIFEAFIAAAKKTIWKKSGYKISPDLGEAGLKVNFWKSIKSLIYRRSQPLPATIKIAEKLQVNIDQAMGLSKNAALKQVDKMVQELRVVQREASQRRQEWLERNAQNIAKAANIDDWRKHMEQMLRMEKEREVNRKLSAITKCPQQSLDWIEVPTGMWYYSHSKKEIYRYHQGVFETFSLITPSRNLIPTSPWRFYKHHHLKVPPDDIVEAQVDEAEDHLMLTAIFKPTPNWRTVTVTKEIEELLLERNKRHLQQSDIEEGRVHNLNIQKLLSNHGTDLLQEVLDGTITIDDAADEVVSAWIWALKQTDDEKALMPITGSISTSEFHGSFQGSIRTHILFSIRAPLLNMEMSCN
jgi:hypothetical protein